MDQRRWIPSRPKFLLPFKPLAQHFRTLFRQQLQKRDPQALSQLPAKIWRQQWVVDSQAVGSGQKALAYLARYIFKTATGNRPLQALPSGQILWPYRDSKTGQPKSIALPPTELIRRFLQHVLPKGFCRVRLFGWLHPAAKIRGKRVRALLQQPPMLTAQEHQTWQGLEESADDLELPEHSSEAQLSPSPICPGCGRAMVLIASCLPIPKSPTPTRPRAP